jgi:exoribonuclease R
LTVDHYALQFKYYTHFTSPIRRYADFIVHRILTNIIDKKKEIQYGHDEMELLVGHINSQSNKARNIQEKCSKLYLSFYLMFAKGHKRYDAVVISLGKRSFTAFVPDLCCEIKCKVMKTFSPLPDSVVDSKQDSSLDDEESINSITLMWNYENNTKRIIELFLLKKILLDIDIDYESLPYEIVNIYFNS